MKIRIRKSFLLYLFIAAALSSPLAVIAMLLALIVHEAGHILIGFLLKESMAEIELTPFGGIIRCETGKSTSKGLKGAAIAAAGPVGNYLFLMILGIKPIYGVIGIEMTKKLITANVSMFALNLLPVLPLDGGRLILNVGFFFMNTTSLINGLCRLGSIAGIGIAALSMYGLVRYQILNCSLIMIGIYIFFCANVSRDTLICENAYSVIQERISIRNGSVLKQQIFTASPDVRILDLLPVISRVSSALFICREGQHTSFISEKELLLAMLADPLASLGDIHAHPSKNNDLE